MNVDWANSSAEELVEAVLHYPAIRVTQVKLYYQKKGRQDIVDKLKEARRLAAIVRMENKLAEMKKE